MKVGFLTIGQSARSDIEHIWKGLIGIAPIEKLGVLDGYSPEEINEKFVSKDNKDILVTKLNNGTAVQVDKDIISSKIQESVNKLEALNCGIIIILCTEDFPGIKSNAIMIKLNDLLINSTKVISNNKRIGIVIPNINQKNQLLKRWNKVGIDPIVFVANPYGSEDEFINVSRQAKEKEINILVLDCLGYDKDAKYILSKESNSRVILSRDLINGFVKSII